MHAQAKAMAVSDERAVCRAEPLASHKTWAWLRHPWAAARPGRATSGQPTLQTSSNQRNSNRLARTSVTNVVNLSPKTSIFTEKADGLTTFVTTGQKSTRKTPWIDDVCNNTRRANHQRPSPTGVEGAGGTGGPGYGARGRRRGLARQHTGTPTDWRPPRGLRGLAGLRADAPSEARGADGERAGRPRGGRRSVGPQTTRSRPAPQGPGGSRIRPLGSHQRRFQRIWVPSEPRRWQASTTRAAMPASADLPHVRGSYCFFTPTSPSILRTPS